MHEEISKLAVHETEIKRLQKDMDKLVEDMEEIKKAISDISRTLAEAKGGWQMMLLLGGVGATVGATLSWVFEQMIGKH